jgi:hypothetical protein
MRVHCTTVTLILSRRWRGASPLRLQATHISFKTLLMLLLILYFISIDSLNININLSLSPSVTT